MSLVPPVLDDRRFDDLRTEALERVRLNCPEWTDFNASDPGITLIELFAWFTELMLFRMNQVPDKLHGELLDLVGIKPEPAKPAQALIEFDPGPDCPRFVPRLTSAPISLGGDRPLRFYTERDLAMVRKPLVAIARKLPGSAETDLTKLNSAADRGFDPFGEAGGPDAELLLRFKADPDDQAGLIFPDILNLHVTTTKRSVNKGFVIPENGPLSRPQLPSISWSARIADNIFEPLEVVEDETKGFDRDGFIRIARPRRAVPIPLQPLPAASGRPSPKAPDHVFELRCRIGAPGFAFGRAPRFLHVAINAVNAIAQTVETDDRLGISTGLQGQVFSLRNRPVELESIRLMTRLSDKSDPASDVSWTRVDDFADSGPHDTHFVLDAASGQIRFGNDVKGQIPRAGRHIVATSYQAGGGAQGNVNKALIKFSHLGATGTNPYPAIGGSAAEPTEALRQRAAARLRSRDRAVTCADFEDLAVRKGQMARAKAIAGLHPDFPALVGRMPGAITVFVVSKPNLDGNLPPWASDAEIDRVRKTLDERRMVGSELFVQSAHIVPVRVTVVVRPVAGQAGDEARHAIRDALNLYLNSEDRGFGTILHNGDLWSCVAQAAVGGVRVAAQIESVTAEVGGKSLGMMTLPRTGGAEMAVAVSELRPEAGEVPDLAVKIADHAVLWGRPDHNIRFEGGAT